MVEFGLDLFSALRSNATYSPENQKDPGYPGSKNFPSKSGISCQTAGIFG